MAEASGDAELVLAAESLTKSFGALVASEAVSLSLVSGEVHALIGPNGAGKSTLVALIAGALPLDGGRVRLRGEDVTALDVAARARRGLGRSFQVSDVAPGFTVLENIALARLAHERRVFRTLRGWRSRTALRRAAGEHAARTGLADRLSVRAADLSHGERRRLELAMVLALEPALFLLDEPLAGLGAEGATAMIALLDELRREAPILLIEHDMDAVFALADRVSVLVYGRVIASGTVEAVRSDAAVREAYLGEELPDELPDGLPDGGPDKGSNERPGTVPAGSRTP